ncbi:MAG TPA: M20/M25/M40 family metallo-hydrolase [Bacteroidia bacterium]|nr:M20/M25/M40 family metallo-hydrolase [Bacteroidia bacterium]
MTKFILNYVDRESNKWLQKPTVYSGGDFMDAVILVFGKPELAVFAHIDSVGFTVGYNNRLIRIGGPKLETGLRLRGHDSKGKVEGVLKVDKETGDLAIDADRIIDRGTDLTFVMDFRETESHIQSCSIDNRLGVWVALQLAESIRDGALVFSTYEEHGGGSAAYLAGFLYQKYNLTRSVICDITWVTEGVHAGKGVALSVRDSGIPRKSYLKWIENKLASGGVNYQIDVESAGGSDGNELQKSPYPFDWCFLGAPEENVHSPEEKVHKDDISAMVNAYKVLLMT